ncbi:hypothetical protein HED60_17720 [Planctomycetales bacterium ZRK34]|nr:hypothetical protein HED60_17720 [Planctomycetales bacterium ZRK34]
MAVTVQERYGRRLSDESAELLYLIRGTSDDAVARSSLSAAAPVTHDGLPISNIEVEELEGLDAYLGTVQYAPPDFEPPAEPSFSFDTSGGTQHITQSLGTVGMYPAPGGNAPNFGGAIGVTQDSVEGVDITIPVYTFSETHYLSAGTVTNAYKGTLFNLTGKVNSGGFKGLAAGECLFLGASGSQRGVGEDWEITFRFAGSPNKTGLHRSGSSALAGVLHHLGVHLGNKLGGYEPAGGFEAVTLAHLCERAYPFPATELAVPRPQLVRDLSSFVQEKRREAHWKNTLAGGKYPHLCAMGGELKEACGDGLRLIHINRPLDESIASLKKRSARSNDWLRITDEQAEAVQRWLWERKAALLEGVDHLTVEFDDLLSNPAEQVERIIQYLNLTPSEDQIARAIGHVATAPCDAEAVAAA